MRCSQGPIAEAERDKWRPRKAMDDQYLISLQVKYEPCATGVKRSLGWLAPELVRADLTLTEDEEVREWAGVIDGDTFERLAGAWGLEHGSHAHVFDGMEFEEAGFSPIVWVSLTVSELDLERLGLARVGT